MEKRAAASPEAAASPLSERPWALLGLLALAGYGLFRFVALEWSLNPQYSYGWGVPLLAAYLFAKRWADRPEPQAFVSGRLIAWAAPLLAMAALPLTFLLEANPDWRLLFWIGGFMYCAALLLAAHYSGGAGWARHFAPPLAVLLLAIPWPSALEREVVQGLTELISMLTVESLRWLGYPALLQGSVIQLPNAVVGVSEACSGIRSVQTTVMLAVFLGELRRLKIGKRALLLGAGLLWTILLNFARTFWLTWLAANGGSTAQERWHDPAGFAALGLSVLGVILFARALGGKLWESAVEPPRTPARLIPRRWALAAAAWLLAVEGGKELWFRSHERGLVPTSKWAVTFPSSADGFREQKLEDDVLAILRCDETQAGVWKRADQSEWTMFHLEWKPGRIAAQSARGHTPETCLPQLGFKLVRKSEEFVLETDGVRLPFESYLFEANGRPWHVFFCLVEDSSAPGGDNATVSTSRARRLLSAWEGKRHRGQQAFEIAMSGYQTEEQAREALAEALPKLVRARN